MRLNNIFKNAPRNPSILDVTCKLYDLIESSILLSKKGGERISLLGSETAADIKTLAAAVLDQVEQSLNLPIVGQNLFPTDSNNHQVEHALEGANPFRCKVPDVVGARLDSIDKALAGIKDVFQNTSHCFNSPNLTTNPKTPSYALAVSRHAPKSTTVPTLTEFRPVLHKKPPPPPPTLLKLSNTITLTQSEREGNELLSMNYATLIALINSKLTEACIKEKTADPKPIQIQSVHRHPSNNQVLYTTTPQQAKELRRQGTKWIPLLSSSLSLHLTVHTVVVHGIPPLSNLLIHRILQC